MIVYVTGVAGFLGSNVAAHLLDLGHEVYGCDNLITGKASNVSKEVNWASFSIQEAVEQFILPLDAVIHTGAIARSAWGNDSELWEHNVKGTMAAVKLANINGARLIHISSSVVHLPNSSTYAKTKEVSERIALSYGATALRFCNIYGPGQSEEGTEPNVIASMRRSIRETGTVRVNGDGLQRRDFIHVTDAASAIIKAAENPSPPIWMDVCTGESISILEIAQKFCKPINWAPSRNDPFEIHQDSEPARYILGWSPQVRLKDGLDQVTQMELNF